MNYISIELNENNTNNFFKYIIDIFKRILIIKYSTIKKLSIFIIFILLSLFFDYYKKIIKIKNTNKLNNHNIKICICTLGKKENKYIREFVEYYQKLGIDQIFLYDNNDKGGERFQKVVHDYITTGFVKLYNWRGKKRKQLEILNHCYINNYNKFDWILFYDIDEYIHISNFRNIKDFLNEKKFINCDIIYLNWVIHTDNNLIYYDNRTLHKRFPTLEPKAKIKRKKYYSQIKSILKGHIPNITISCQHKLTSGLKTCNGFGIKPKLKRGYMISDYKYYYIDHYYFKSLDEFIDKLNKGSVRTYNDIKIKIFRLKRFFLINQVNKNKIKYIEKKTGINIKKYYKYLLKKKVKFYRL